MLKYYNGAITRTDIRTMPNSELLSYINAANTLEKQNEPEQPGLTGEAALEAMKHDPAITVR